MTPPLPSPPAHAVHEPAPDDREPKTRRPMVVWDRIKVLVILAAFIVFSAAYLQSRIPVLSFGEALENQLQAKWWVLTLMGLETLRQIHYLISERSVAWHQFWQERVFGGWERRMRRLNPWNRYRAQRIGKLLFFGTIAVFFFAWKWNVAPANVIATAPGRIADGLFKPMTGSLPLFWLLILYSFMGIFSIAIFYLFFFFGGIETYKPGEIKTRFADVWGQDPVLRRVSETVDFLERPEEIEAKGGHVPGGMLLWGPPGTGKTLMAEAVAGETGKPYMFVDPSAFIQTFMGVAPMKVKWMYRKVRKLALRHGGVVVFFDEADALGNRGQTGGYEEASTSWNGDASLQRHVVRRRPHHGDALADPPGAAPPGRAGAGAGGQAAVQDPGHHHDGRRRGRRFGRPPGPADRDVRIDQAPRLLLPALPLLPHDQAEAAAQVPDPAHHGHQPARHPRRGDAAPRPNRPQVQGRLSARRRQEAHLRGLFRQDPSRSHAGADREAGLGHAVLHGRHDQGHRQRVDHRRHAGPPRRRRLDRRPAGQDAQALRRGRRLALHRARAPSDGGPRGLPRRGHVPAAQAAGDRRGHHPAPGRDRRLRQRHPRSRSGSASGAPRSRSRS